MSSRGDHKRMALEITSEKSAYRNELTIPFGIIITHKSRYGMFRSECFVHLCHAACLRKRVFFQSSSG